MLPEPDAIERFMRRLRTATQARSKDIRFTIEEANELGHAVGEVLARVAALSKAPAQAEAPISIAMDGGSLG